MSNTTTTTPAPIKTRKKFFFRIEHRDSLIGPYNHRVDEDEWDNGDLSTLMLGWTPFQKIMAVELGKDFCGKYHKTPQYDGLAEHVQDSSRFGFQSIAKVKKWFGTDPNTYDLFERFGFVLRKYKVSERFDSSRQSIAMIEDMTEFVELPLFETLVEEKP